MSREAFKYEEVGFNHPLWILFSSGTTGLPKPIMHSHGGIIIEQLKHVAFNFDMRAGERLFFFTTTGWMMWNFLVSSLLSDVIPVLYDGNPAWPDGDLLWKMVQDAKANLFGASPTYQSILEKNGVVPKNKFDLSSLESVTLAGSPVSPECQAWFYENVKKDCWVAPGCGGTDICSGFVGGVVTLPSYAGEIQARCLGVAVHVIGENGQIVTDEVGEMVVTQPMPSMPVGFWNDKNDERYHRNLFQRFPRHVAPGRFLPRECARRRVRAGSLRCHAEPPWHPHRHLRDLSHHRAGAWRRGWPDRQPRPARRQVLHAAVRQAEGWRGAG